MRWDGALVQGEKKKNAAHNWAELWESVNVLKAEN